MKHRYTRPLAIAVLLALVAAVVVLTKPTASVKAQTGGVPKAPMVPSVINVGPPVTGVNHILQGTYINTCIPSCPPLVIFPQTLFPLDPVTTINCPAPTGKTCTITDDMWIELLNLSTTTTNNPETLLFFLDGRRIADQFNDGGGGTPGGPQYDAMAQKTSIFRKVSSGTHTVQTQTVSLYGAGAQAWTATYRVYVP